MNKALFIFSFFLLNIFALAQSQNIEQQKQFDIIPPSANAFLLGLYGQSKVSMSTGTLNETIDLYNYKTPNLTVPINLHYSTNGIKVDQMESHVGIDWILEAGGVITRVVKSKPDEERRGELISDLHCYSQEMVNYVYNSTYTYKNDTEPDIFMFNFIGKSGNFVLDNQKNVMLIEQQDLKFEIVKEGLGLGIFIATDELGIQYHFENQEKTSLEIDAQVPHKTAITAWYLTKIVHPKGDEIYFNYKENFYSYSLARDESIKSYVSPLNTCPGSFFNDLHTTTIITNYNLTTFGQTLESITSNVNSAGIIQLENNYSPPLNPIRDNYHDVPTGYKFISSIAQKDVSGKVLEKVNLTYGYRNRVFLDKVDFTITNKKYELFYKGTPNKRNGNKDAWGYNSSETAIYPDPFKNYLLYGVNVSDQIKKQGIITGDKFTTDAIYNGLLSKIIYPTKGYNTFEYGANQTIGTVLIPRKLNGESIGLHSTSKSGERTFINVGKDYESTLQITLNIFGFDHEGWQVPWDQEGHTFSLYEESSPNTNNYHFIGSYSTVRVGETTSYPVKLKANTKYKLTGKLTTSNPNFEAYALIEYIEIPEHEEEKKIYTNGVHISKIKSFNNDGTLTNYKKYYYNKKNSEEPSGKPYYHLPNYFTQGQEMSLCQLINNSIPYPLYNDYKIFHSKSVTPMFSEFGNNKMTFERVAISEGGDNFEKGGKEYLFNISWPSLGQNCSMHHTNPAVWAIQDLKHGTLNTENILDSNQKIIKSAEYTYEEEREKRKTIIGVSIQMNFNSIYGWTNDGPNINPKNIEHLGITKYEVRSFKHYLQQVKTKTFTPSGSVIEETENNFYDSPNHLQLSKREIVYNNKTKIDKFYYPDDLLNVNSLPEGPFSNPQFEAIKALRKDKSHETATVIQKESFVNNNKIGTERINYLLMANKSLPHEIQWKKQETLPFEKTTTFKHYNNFGLPMEIENKGTNTVYLYGHDQSLLIAKIDNSTKEAVASALGVTVANLNTINETKLTQINNLRQNASFKEAMISTYEHKPLVGITKMTDPKGLSISYEYNTANQLQNIKDASGNILEEYEYNYKTD